MPDIGSFIDLSGLGAVAIGIMEEWLTMLWPLVALAMGLGVVDVIVTLAKQAAAPRLGNKQTEQEYFGDGTDMQVKAARAWGREQPEYGEMSDGPRVDDDESWVV